MLAGVSGQRKGVGRAGLHLLQLCAALAIGAGLLGLLGVHEVQVGGMKVSIPTSSVKWIAGRARPSARPASAAPPHAARLGGCSEEMCSLDGPEPGLMVESVFGGSRLGAVPHARSPVAAGAAPARTATGVAADDRWWDKDKELWTDVHTADDYWREINNSDKDLVIVDWYATWCQSCRMLYPRLCSFARDKDLRKRFKFIKANVDELKPLAKEQEVLAMPFLIVYRKGDREPLVGWHLPPSKMKHLRKNVELIAEKPESAFAVDPNGFVISTGPRLSAPDRQRVKDEKKKEVEDMARNRGGLFDHLMKIGAVGERKERRDKAVADAGARREAAAEPAAVAPAPAPAGPSKAKRDFLEKYGHMYGYGGQIDALYESEVGARLNGGHYLDYTGSSVYTSSQLDSVFHELKASVFGNPHSANPSSALSSRLIEEARDRVLKHFNASPVDYHVVFTKSATGALKTVGEAFPWTDKSEYVYLRENHNSVLGVREFALQKQGTFRALTYDEVEEWLCDTAATQPFDGSPTREPTYNLFAFPAEDNFAGIKYPLRWIEAVRAKSTAGNRWKVMLDAAAFAPTNPLDLSAAPADFVSVSFYKMFGYPTGLGALLIRAENVDLLQEVYWAGGTVAVATAGGNFHSLRCNPSERFEEGTVAFLDIVSLRHGFDAMEKLGGINRIQGHVTCLAEWLHGAMRGLKHRNGAPLVRMFGRHGDADARDTQGAVLNFVVLGNDGMAVPYKRVEDLAAQQGFHVRTGCECNPGACYACLGLSDDEVEQLAGEKEGCNDDYEFVRVQRPRRDVLQGKVIQGRPRSPELVIQAAPTQTNGEGGMQWVDVPLGTVRVSLGWWSTFEDCEAFVGFLKTTFLD
ncbi:unnamed protein product [Pedinophyceae sp. YPF-701]|nr:unnamed protein product [Pedinophyceae sp. YPF-701]